MVEIGSDHWEKPEENQFLSILRGRVWSGRGEEGEGERGGGGERVGKGEE